MKTLILSRSFTGNTEKVTKKIEETLKSNKIRPDVMKISKDIDIELHDYDLVFLGVPVIEFLPPKPVLDFIHSQLTVHRKRGTIIPCSPKIPGKYAVCYCTYSGPHTGIREAIPAVKYMTQFFEHLRFFVLEEWYVVGEFVNNEILSTKGSLGDIRGRPNKNDLLNIESKVNNLLQGINFK
jgi:multimeric flavodoxin WrbA